MVVRSLVGWAEALEEKICSEQFLSKNGPNLASFFVYFRSFHKTNKA